MIFLSLAFALKHKESQRKARTFSNFQEAAVVDTKTQIAVTPLPLYLSEVSIASSRSVGELLDGSLVFQIPRSYSCKISKISKKIFQSSRSNRCPAQSPSLSILGEYCQQSIRENSWMEV